MKIYYVTVASDQRLESLMEGVSFVQAHHMAHAAPVLALTLEEAKRQALRLFNEELKRWHKIKMPTTPQWYIDKKGDPYLLGGPHEAITVVVQHLELEG